MIIDTHVHIGDMIGFHMTEEDVLYSMQQYGIDHSIVSCLDAAEFDHELRLIPSKYCRSQIECLQKVVDFAKKYPDRISAAAWLRPYNEKADYDLYKTINDNRKYIKAIKFHPFHSNVPFDSVAMEPFIELAQHYGLPVVVHTGGSDAASCVRVYNMAKRFPKTRFVMVHMGLGTDNKEAIELVARQPNLMFGSDNPIDGPDTYLHNRHGDRSLYQDYFHVLPRLLSPEDYNRLMYQNAADLFGISLH